MRLNLKSQRSYWSIESRMELEYSNGNMDCGRLVCTILRSGVDSREIVELICEHQYSWRPQNGLKSTNNGKNSVC